jgi:hypothetical protein
LPFFRFGALCFLTLPIVQPALVSADAAWATVFFFSLGTVQYAVVGAPPQRLSVKVPSVALPATWLRQ